MSLQAAILNGMIDWLGVAVAGLAIGSELRVPILPERVVEVAAYPVGYRSSSDGVPPRQPHSTSRINHV